MHIVGLNKTTLLDYPGHVAATLFTGGCNFCCPFCQNGDLVLRPNSLPVYKESEIFSFLEKRKNVLSGVCITGGEPTLQSDLASFIKELKSMGYLIKLDTNGSRPDVIEALLSKNLLDYVAMDIKSSKTDYARVAGCESLSLSQIEQSVSLLMHSGIPYEFRTTVVKGLHDANSFEEIGSWLKGESLYFLQSYKESENVIQNVYSSFTKEELAQFLNIVKKYLPNAALRGV